MMDKIKKKSKKIKSALDKAMKYLRIHDEKGMVSLTNIAMIIVLYKLMMTPAVSFQDITALAIAVMGYQIKRVVEKK